jgi:hypothetical protein
MKRGIERYTIWPKKTVIYFLQIQQCCDSYNFKVNSDESVPVTKASMSLVPALNKFTKKIVRGKKKNKKNNIIK